MNVFTKFVFRSLIFSAFLLIFASIGLILSIKPVFAIPVDNQWLDCPFGQSYCTQPKPADCKNGPSNTDSGGCGTACGAGSAWSKYTARCKEIIEGSCNWAWVYSDLVCSIADKCTGDQGLKPGQCECGTVGNLYKLCCTSGTSTTQCINYSVQDPYPPPEGVCPAGSTAKFCGWDGYPPCSAVGAVCGGGGPGPSPTPTPPPPSGDCPGNTTFNNCAWCTTWSQCANSGAPSWWTISGSGYCSNPNDIRCCLCTWNVAPPPPPPPSCTVNLTPDSTSLMAGQSTTLVASVSPSNGTVDRVDFLSSNTTIVTVNPTSDTTATYSTTATGVGAGSTTVSASVIMGGSLRCSDTSTITVSNPGPWFQVKDADIQSGGNLVSKIPAQCVLPDCDPKFDLDGTGGYPGVCAYGGTTANFGSGTVSSKGWLANSGYAGRRYDYAFFEKLTPDGAFQTPITESEVTGGDLISGFQSGGYIWRYRNGNLTINGTTNLGIRKVILLVDGNLTINGRITLDDGTGFFATFVSGNIAVDPTVSHPNQPAIEGVFMADGTISTGTRITSSDDRLYIRGMLAAWGGINLQRDLDPTKASGANNTSAAEFIEYAPDLVFSFPRELARRGIVWREIAP